jgi:prepilin-type processing-associated H-X9-DG protein
VATAVYAADDGKGRLPSFPLPVEHMTQYTQLEPAWVAFEMITNLTPHGVTLPMWFCPARPNPFAVHSENFRLLRGRPMASPTDLVDEFVNVQKAAFAGPDLFWWVPRKLTDSSLEYPDPNRMETRVPDGWPRRLDDPTISTQPIISDWLVGEWDEVARTATITGGSGGHARGGEMKSINAGFADGHVETRPKAVLQWQAKGPRGHHAYIY